MKKIKNYVGEPDKLFFTDPGREIIFQLGRVVYDPENFSYTKISKIPSSRDQNNFWDRGVYVQDIFHTLQYDNFQTFCVQQKQQLPLLRKAVCDASIPTHSHLSLGSEYGNVSILEQLQKCPGREEMVSWIRWLQDKEVIPYLRKVLVEEDKSIIDDNYAFIEKTKSLKQEVIKTLASLGAQEVIIDYLLQEEAPDIQLIKIALGELEQTSVSENFLPVLEKIIR